MVGRTAPYDLKLVTHFTSTNFTKSFFNFKQNIQFSEMAQAMLSAPTIQEIQKSTQSDHIFNRLYYLIDKVMDFSTPENCAIFYSGENRVVAEKMAKTFGKFTLELTSGGRYLDELDLFNINSTYKSKPLRSAQASLLWDLASTKFAVGASGRVFAFTVGIKPIDEFQTLRTFFRVELPILINQNKDVDEIEFKNNDGTTSSIFSRQINFYV